MQRFSQAVLLMEARVQENMLSLECASDWPPCHPSTFSIELVSEDNHWSLEIGTGFSAFPPGPAKPESDLVVEVRPGENDVLIQLAAPQT